MITIGFILSMVCAFLPLLGMVDAGDFGAFLAERGKDKKGQFAGRAKALGVKVLGFWYKDNAPMRKASNGIQGGHLALLQFGNLPPVWLGMTEYRKCINASPRGSVLFPPFADTIHYWLGDKTKPEEGLPIAPYDITPKDLWGGILNSGFADKIFNSMGKPEEEGHYAEAKADYEAKAKAKEAKAKAEEAKAKAEEAKAEEAKAKGKGKG